MKKNYLTKLSWMGVALFTVLLVACGLKITKVTLSANEIAPGGEVTVTTQFNNPDTGNDMNNSNGIYLVYAIRVPQDWTASGVLQGVNNYQGASTTFDFKESPAYAALAELCYPKDGYIWLGFQTKDKVDVNCDPGEDNVITTLTLKGGNQPGDYKLDIMAGSFQFDPSTLLNKDGSVNVDYAFGNNNDFSQPEATQKYTDGEDEIEMFPFSEYLVCTSTISPEEMEDRKFALMDYTSTVQNQTYPVTPYDISNSLTDEEIAALQLNVKVTGDGSGAVNKLQGADDVNAPVYNLQGVQVADPTAPGIYIKNGKKYVVK